MKLKSTRTLFPVMMLSLAGLAACDRDVQETSANTDTPATVAQDTAPSDTGSTTPSQDPYTSATAPTDTSSMAPTDAAQQTDAPMSGNAGTPTTDGMRNDNGTGQPTTTTDDDSDRTGGDATDDNAQRTDTPQP